MKVVTKRFIVVDGKEYPVIGGGSGLDISAFTAPVTDVVGALTTAAPTIVGGVATIVAGLVAANFGFRWIRRHAK